MSARGSGPGAGPRIVVTGLGVVSALGNDVATFDEALFKGDVGIGPITLYDDGPVEMRVAAEVRGYDEKDHFSNSQLTLMDRFAQFALLSAREAVADSGLDFAAAANDKYTPGNLGNRTAVVHGTGIGGQSTQDASYHRLLVDQILRTHPFTIPKLMPNAGASQISMEFGITGPSLTTATACASTAHAIAMAVMLLRSGQADVAITGGAEACINFGTMLAWKALRVTAKDTCRPFSNKRGGMVVGEGGGTLILETLEHARARGATIHAELTGIGMSADAGNIIQPSGDGAALALANCLSDAGLSPEDVDYINAHGTGTAQNDPTESAAIRKVFGTHADNVAVSSTKSMHGHALGAAAALEAVATILALRRQTAPATMNYLEPDPKCDLDYVPNAARPMEIRNALCNSFAFGGLNAVVGFSRFQG
ncbi:MAG: beta-ketoacyl-[acyl-carrier-protein] synthase family protein [Gammaproteobacteria bacterium]